SVAESLRDRLVPWSVNSLAQIAGMAALDDAAFVARTHQWLSVERKRLEHGLRALSDFLTVLPSQANFLLLRLRAGSAPELTQRLLERGIAVRDASNFVGLDERYIRVAV